jgi:phosphoadenosine phosphosulfate reductase
MTIVDKINESKALIKKAAADFERLAVAVSGGKDSVVVLHLARQAAPNTKIFAVMTRFKPPETRAYLKLIERFMQCEIIVFENKTAIIAEGFYNTDPDECCRILKVEPTFEALKVLKADAWITGLRRTEGRTRVNFMPLERYIEIDGRQVFKVNPILDWTETDIWKYFAINQIPVHPFYAKGYRSLGCAPCTKIVDDSETERAGRWQNTSKCGGECGIHSVHKKEAADVR